MAERAQWAGGQRGTGQWAGARMFRSASVKNRCFVNNHFSASARSAKSSGAKAGKQRYASADTGRPIDTGESKTPVRIRLVRRIVVGLLIAAAAVVAGEVTFQTLLAPNLAINTIYITGDSVLSDGELADIADLERRLLYFHVDTEAVSNRLESVAEVKSASVTTEFPDTLRIDLTARSALAVTTFVQDRASVPAVVDGEGVVFRAGLRSSEYDLPVLSGLQLERFALGDALPSELLPLFEDLYTLRTDEPDLFAAISEVRIVQRGGRYETILYPVHARVPVRMPARAEAQRYETAFHAIDILEQQGTLDSVEEIDLRSGDVVYTMSSEG